MPTLEAFQFDAFQSGAFQSEVATETGYVSAFQKCVFQFDAFQVEECILPEEVLTATPGFHGRTLKAYIKKQETDEEKRLRREAQGIIARVKVANPDKKDGRLLDDAVDVVEQIKIEIARLDLKAKYFERINQQQNMIQAQLAQEQLNAQIEEIDAVFVMFMMAAQID